jgi:hypothetical protein
VALVGLAFLLLVAVLGGWAYLASPDDGGLRGTVWKYEKGDVCITLEFSRLGYIVGNPVVKYTTAEGSARGSGEMTYTVLDGKTLSLASGQQGGSGPTVGPPSPGGPAAPTPTRAAPGAAQTLTIDSMSNERLLLSGGPWKLDKTEFTRQK